MGRRRGELDQRFGDWKVTGTLGAGGMGVVYNAVREDGQRAALKVVNPGLASDPQFRVRFRREIEVSRRVSGTRTAAVIDADPNSEPPWLATEYVDGPNLEEAVSRTGPLKSDSLVALAISLLQALVEIHSVGVVHRDLKPSNVILTAATPKVIDFGIALDDGATSLTATGAFIGSPGWMSPEQIRGEQVTSASDVFSWAALMVYAATGRPPFGEGRPETVAYRVVHAEPDLTGVPQPIIAAIEQGLRREPAMRPTPRALISQLAYGKNPSARVAQGWATVPATLLVPPDRTSLGNPNASAARPQYRRSWLWATAVALVVAVAVGVGAIGLARRGETPTTSLAGTGALETATTTSPEPDSPSSIATSSTSPSTAAAPSTTTLPLTEPLFEGRLTATTREALTLLDFAESHKLQTIRIDAALDGLAAEDLYRLDDNTHALYVPGTCEQFCEGDAYELLIRDLDTVPDAAVFYDSGAIEINGRFVVSDVQFQNGGIFSISLRAVGVA